MHHQPGNDRARLAAGAGGGQRPGHRGGTGEGIRVTDAIRVNRYLAAAGLGTRRGVEQLIRAGRVSVNGEPALVTTRVNAGDDVRVDGAPLASSTGRGVIWHRPHGVQPTIVHPGRLQAVCPLRDDQSGLELLLADAVLARRLADPRFPLREGFAADGMRIRLAAVRLGRLAPGEWRPLSAREHAQLRRGVRLPPPDA